MMFRQSILIIIGIFFATLHFSAANAAENLSKEEFDSVYKIYLDLYASFGKDKTFYQYSERIKQYYRQHGDKDNYYRMRCNEVLYDIAHNQPYPAIQKANAMLTEMKSEGYTDYSMVYMSLGTVFETRGSQRMAEHYYREAIANTQPNNEKTLVDLYSRMASLLKFSNPAEATKWNEKYAESSKKYPNYRQVYLFVKALIAFTGNDKQTFLQVKNEYQQYYADSKADLFNYGQLTFQCMDEAFKGNYENAIDLLRVPNSDIDEISRYDLRIIVYRMSGQLDKALEQATLRANCVDSISSDMLFNNLNQVSSDAGVAKMQSEAASRQLQMLYIVLILAATVIIILVIAMMVHRRTQKRINQKNEQLRMALSMAEESDKMKTEFVRSVSHEIRTPLNAINGFNEIINNNDIDLSDSERRDLLNRIKDNVQAITKIVDEMLQMAERGSSDFYPKTGAIYPNQFLSKIIYSQRNNVRPDIELLYTTKVINRFSIHTNQEGVRKIIDHLLSNAIKFTDKGFIELHCELSPDQKHVLISVTDTGRGIEQEKQEKIFEQFYKADMFQQGIGLGLTVSKKIARKLGGDLILDHNYTDGARFVLSLPIE